MADKNQEVRVINRGGPGGNSGDQPAYLQRQDAKLLNVIDTKQIDTAKEVAKEQAERHSQIVQILKKGFALDEFEYLRKEGQRAMNGTNKDNDPDPDFTSMLGMGKLRKWLNGSFVGKVVNSVDQILTGAASKGLGVVAKFLPAKLVSGLSKVVSIGVGKLFAVAMAAFDLSKGFRDDEFTKKLTGGNSFLDKLYAGVLNMLSGLTLGIFSPEQIKVGTEKLRGMVGPYLDKIFDYTVKPIGELVDWVDDKTKNVSKAYDDVKSKVQKSWDDIGNSVSGFSKNISEAFDNFVKAAYDKLPEPIKKGLSWVQAKYSQAKTAITGAKDDAVIAAKAVKTTAAQSVEAGKQAYEGARADGKGVVTSAGEAVKAGVGEVQASSRMANYQALQKELDAQGYSKEAKAALLGNIAAESGFKAQSEDLSGYAKTSNDRIRQIFKSKTKGLSDEQLTEIKKDPRKFGDLVYGHLGGYDYRGRGFNQLTGKDNYAKYSKMLFGDDRLVKNPDLVNDPAIAAKIAVAYNKDRADKVAQKRYGKSLNELSYEQASEVTTQAVAGEGSNIKTGYLAQLAKEKEEKGRAFLTGEGEAKLAALDKKSPVAKGSSTPVQVAKATPVVTPMAEAPAAKVTKAEPTVAMNRPVEKETIKKDESKGSTAVASSGSGSGEGRVSLASIPMIPQNDKLALLNSGLV